MRSVYDELKTMLTRRLFISALPALHGMTKSRLDGMGGREYHVATHGDDAHEGTSYRPLRTISAAAARAHAGDTITVHEGIYRERVAPPRGGTSDTHRIIYRAAPGERVVICGSEVIKGWERVKDDVWRASIPNHFFGDFNPYRDVIHGDWFEPKGRVHHTGAVYLNGHWFAEAATLADVYQKNGGIPLWFGEVGAQTTTLWAQFKGVDPNQQLTEINVRKTVFYPAKTGVNYITVRGFILRHAATPWAPPTAEQVGLIGTHWSKGWVIEHNIISYSICSGIALGKYGDQWDNTSGNSAEGYVKTIERAVQAGWSKETIGSHVVRNNIISHCEQTGIVGSLGPVFSVVEDNTIHDIHVRRLFGGAELAGIKFHAAIDVKIRRNHIYRTCRGIWLDWMAQGTRVTRNLFHDNQNEDLFVEVDHGPFIVDNNIFLSKFSERINSQGGAYAHNLFCGRVTMTEYDPRKTPFMRPHSTKIAGYHDNPSGDMRFYNNIFAGESGLTPFNKARLAVHLGGNVFLKNAKPCSRGKNPLIKPEFDPGIQLTEKKETFQLAVTLDAAWLAARERKLVASALLGRAVISNARFERSDGAPLQIDTDYFGCRRRRFNPCPGPFEFSGGGRRSMNVWPLKA